MESVQLNHIGSITSTSGAHLAREGDAISARLARDNPQVLNAAANAEDANPAKQLSDADKSRAHELKKEDRAIRDEDQAHKRKASDYDHPEEETPQEKSEQDDLEQKQKHGQGPENEQLLTPVDPRLQFELRNKFRNNRETKLQQLETPLLKTIKYNNPQKSPDDNPHIDCTG